MAQTQTLLMPHHFSSYTPTSPDPTPLRLLAFSVAESALESDPDSPLYLGGAGLMEGDWVGEWCDGLEGKKGGEVKSRGHLWGVVEHARERREKVKEVPRRPKSPLASPPISPSAYTFSNPKLAEPRPTRPIPPSLNLQPIKQYRPLHTRSTEPSPTHSTFSSLDQSRPPPEFIPRLTASEFVKVEVAHTKASPQVAEPLRSPSEVLRKQATTKLRGGKVALPSLAQIQAKMSKSRAHTHKRGSSLGAVPLPRSAGMPRSDTQESVEVLVTPTDENGHKAREPRIVLQSILNRGQTPSPPSPTVPLKESRLAPFLRQRTSGRLASATRPISVPPRTQTASPILRIIPPTLPNPSNSNFKPSTPTRSTITPGYPFPTLATPPQNRYRPNSTSPVSSPTSPCSAYSNSQVSSPTLSVPMITCTPARLDGEEESDDEGSVVVFSAEEEGERVKVEVEGERERRGREMRAMLIARRKSD